MKSAVWAAAVFASVASCASDRFRDGDSEGGGLGADCADATAGDVRCTASGGFERCVDGDWLSGFCDNNDCSNGQCGTNACPDGDAMTCGANGTIRTCRSDVGGFEISACDAGLTCVGNSCQAKACLPGVAYCEGNVAYQCNDNGTDKSLVATCDEGEVCTSGLCLSACELAESRYSFVGCQYYAVDSDNDSANDTLQTDIVVGNPSSDESVSVTISEHVGGAWTGIYEMTVLPRGVKVVPITCTGDGFFGTCQPGNLRSDRHPEDTMIGNDYAFRVDSTQPIFAYQFNSDDLDLSASSSGATILMPKAALDRQYYALTMPQRGSDRSWVEVVAMEDNTSVTLRASNPTVGGGGINALGAGESLTASLDDGDVLQIASLSDGDDLSGTFVDASSPVAVFAGVECTRVDGGTCSSSSGAGDHIEEAMMPIVTWGQSFVAAHVRHPSNQASRTQATWKIVAWKNDTTVSFEPGPGTGGLPDEQTLGAGDVLQFTTTGENGHFHVASSEAIQMIQILHGETASIVVIPQEQYLDDYVFLAPGFFDNTLTIARPIGATVKLDDADIASAWADASGGYEVTWVDDLLEGSHEITAVAAAKGSGPGIQLVGVDINCSYGYLGGLNASRINPIE